MMRRTWIALLLITSLSFAGVKEAYKKAKRMRGEKQRLFAAEQAAANSGGVSGSDYLYLGFLWQYAKDWDKAIEAFNGYAREVPKGKNRPRAIREMANCQLMGGKYDQVTATVKDFVGQYPSHDYLGTMRYFQGRARRAAGRLEDAIGSFKKGVIAGNKSCAYEVSDCFVQLGRYPEARSWASEHRKDTGQWKTLMAALGNLGAPLPKKLDIDFWMGSELAMSEIKSRVAVWSFWSTKIGGARDRIHQMTNHLALKYKKNTYIFGPAVYLKFNPINMKANPDMTRNEEQSYVSGWQEEYELQYDLIVLGDNGLHNFCGVDPAYPALPCFALTDSKGKYRYIRVGQSPASLEAVESMLKRLLSE
jgi:tetratricopeptide (TPR) repeat protein